MTNTLSILKLPLADLEDVADAVGSMWEKLRNRRLLLTGGTGFIGKWLLATALHANRKFDLSLHIVVLSRSPRVFLDDFPELIGATEIEWVQGDVRDLNFSTVGVCDFAIHAATDVVSSSSPSEILDTCILGTRRVIDVMKRGAQDCRLLLLSSGAVYGSVPATLRTIPESFTGAPDPLLVTSAYGEGKRVSELLCALAAAECPALEFSVARCFAFVGPYLPFDKQFAIGNFIGAALYGQDIIIQGDGTPLRSYLYASDLAHWLWILLLKAPSGRAYNIGGDEILSIGDLAYRVNKLLNGKGSVLIAQPPEPGKASKAYVSSINRISNELGLAVKVNLDEAIIRTAQWAKSSS